MKYKNCGVGIFVVLFMLTFALSAEAELPTTKQIETINYKLLDKEGNPIVCYITSDDEITLFLKVTPDITQTLPVLYTVFMNGEQIECLWNNKLTCVYYQLIEPQKTEFIALTIREIPEGRNTLQFGSVYYPSKIHWNNTESINRYTLNLNPFTIVRNIEAQYTYMEFTSKKSEQENGYFEIQNIGINGFLSSKKGKQVSKFIYNVDEINHLYYYWQNPDNIPINAKFSLLVNWKQTTWPNTGKLFIDIKSYPKDIVFQEIDLSTIIKEEINHICVVAFVNPDISFWYYDTSVNDWEANPQGAQGYSTQRTLIIK